MIPDASSCQHTGCCFLTSLLSTPLYSLLSLFYFLAAARPSYHGPRILTSTPHHNRVAFARRCLQKAGQSSSQSRTIIPRQMLPPFSSLGHTEIKLSPEMVPTGKYTMSAASTSLAKARALQARKENDAMVYLDGAQIYTCAMCRTHLTSHDDVVSKSFHGHHGRFAVGRYFCVQSINYF